MDLPRRLAAEGLGTGLLLATIVGSGIMGDHLAGGNVAIALLCNIVAIVAVLVVLIVMLGPISGAHFNPVVSLLFAWRRQLSPVDTALYIATQIAGAVAGVWLAHAMFGLPILQVSHQARTGPGQWLSEGVATFGLILTIFATHQARRAFVPAAVGLYILGACWFTASTSFANPAVTLARSLTDGFDGIRPIDVAPFIAAQFAGAFLGFVFSNWLLHPHPKAHK